MIHVIASIRVKPGRMADFLEIFKANVPLVLNEKGCCGYLPAVDAPTDLRLQEREADTVTILERWESVDDLKAHLASAHMLAYREKVKDLVEKTTIRILAEA